MDIPRTKPLPHEFFVKVAEAYDRHAETGRPAAVIAEEWGVGVRRVHRWVGECRKRGMLAPVEIGRVGDGTKHCPTCDGSGRVSLSDDELAAEWRAIAEARRPNWFAEIGDWAR